MSKTLADMTAEERADCVGMWCSIAGAGRLCMLLSTENDVANLGFSHDNEFTMLSPLKHKNVTPRFDLPRVWTPNGEPVPMKKERGFCGTAGLETTVHKYGSGTIYVSEDTPHGEVYRWIGDWEQTND